LSIKDLENCINKNHPNIKNLIISLKNSITDFENMKFKITNKKLKK
jgi:hypothetical protein